MSDRIPLPPSEDEVFKQHDASVPPPPPEEQVFSGTRLLQRAGEAISAPFRGFRGLGVGAQHLIQGEGVGASLERAAEAVKPGFEPRPGEKIGSFVGEMAPTLPLGAASLPARLAASAAQAGGERLAETGSVKDAAKSGGLAVVLQLAGEGIGKVLAGGTKDAARNAIAAGKGLDRDIVDNYLDAGILNGAKGSTGSVNAAVKTVKEAVLKARDEAGKRVEDVRKRLGFKLPLEKTEARMLGKAERKLPAVLADVNGFVAKRTSKLDLDTAFTLRDELSKHIKDQTLSPLELKVLTDKKRALDGMIGRNPAGKVLLRVNKAYAGIMDELETFGKSLEAPELTEAAILRVVKAGDKAVGNVARLKNAMGKVVPGNTLTNAANEVAARQFKGRANAGTSSLTRAMLSAAGSGIENAIGPKGVRLATRTVEEAAALPTRLVTPGLTSRLAQEIFARKKEARRGN